MTVTTSNGHCDMVTHDLGADHSERFALSGVDFARHNGRAGLVFGERELAEAAARAATEETDVVGDFHERSGDDVEGAVDFDKSVVTGESFELEKSEILAGKIFKENLFEIFFFHAVEIFFLCDIFWGVKN